MSGGSRAGGTGLRYGDVSANAVIKNVRPSRTRHGGRCLLTGCLNPPQERQRRTRFWGVSGVSLECSTGRTEINIPATVGASTKRWKL